MPDAAGNIKGIATTGKAGETIERIFGSRTRKECGQNPKTCKFGDHCADCRLYCDWCPNEATHEVSGSPACEDCWEKAYGLD